jgi:hypothetical protein
VRIRPPPPKVMTISVYGPASHAIFSIAAPIGYTLAAINGELTSPHLGCEISKGARNSSVAVRINNNQLPVSRR